MVHFHRGSIAERVAASCCMPVMFAPVNIDGTNYVDGGLMMNLPVSTLRRVCDMVVAVNVSPILAQDYKMNIVSIAMRSFHFMFRAMMGLTLTATTLLQTLRRVETGRFIINPPSVFYVL